MQRLCRSHPEHHTALTTEMKNDKVDIDLHCNSSHRYDERNGGSAEVFAMARISKPVSSILQSYVNEDGANLWTKRLLQPTASVPVRVGRWQGVAMCDEIIVFKTVQACFDISSGMPLVFPIVP